MAHSDTRVADDGEAYTYDDFLAWYGTRVDRKWQNATPVSDAAQHVNVIATQHNIIPPRNSATTIAAPLHAAAQYGNVDATAHDLLPPRSSATANANAQAAATEHSHTLQPTLVPLSLADAEMMRNAEAARTPLRSLHRLARDALNAITSAGVNSTIDKNLDCWFPWKEYIACHGSASDIIGEGVTHAVAEFIEGTCDANQGGQQRLDFVVYRLDGTHCRLHPGTKKTNDAKPIFSYVTDGQNHATEQIRAQLMWSALPQMPFTYELGSTIAKIDQIGKQEAVHHLQNAPLGQLPITADAPFKWWLFVCNLGKKTREVFGPGIIAASLEEKTRNHAQLIFTRCDHTEITVAINPKTTRIV